VVPLPVALVVGFMLLLFAIPVLSFAIAVFAHALYMLPRSLRRWTDAIGWMLYAGVVGGYMWVAGSAAYRLGSVVIDGMITRLVG